MSQPHGRPARRESGQSSDVQIRQEGPRFGATHAMGGASVFQGNFVGLTISERYPALPAPRSRPKLTVRRLLSTGPIRLRRSLCARCAAASQGIRAPTRAARFVENPGFPARCRRQIPTTTLLDATAFNNNAVLHCQPLTTSQCITRGCLLYNTAPSPFFSLAHCELI
jgi:hypothetical protein